MTSSPRRLKYISLFSGIEAASVAWHKAPLNWEPQAFAEIEAFPSAVLAHRFPTIPNLGDVTKVDWSRFTGKVDLIVGGSPCQAFSVAGLRKSLDDARGNLALAYVKICDIVDPEFIVYENVPGILSTKDNAFGCLLAGLVGADEPLVPPGGGRWANAGLVAGPRRSLAWRILDAQFHGVAQRRRRVFAVAVRGAGESARRAAEILLECESLRRDPPARGPARPGAAGSPSRGVGVNGEVAHTLKADGFDGSEDGTGRGQPLVTEVAFALPFDPKQIGHPANFSNPKPGDPCHPPRSIGNCEPAVVIPAEPLVTEVPPIGFYAKGGTLEASAVEDVAPPLKIGPVGVAYRSATEFLSQSSRVYHEGDVAPAVQAAGTRMGNRSPQVQQAMAVRRFTPRECERLQGFPDDWTLIPMSKRVKAQVDADMARYYRRDYPDATDEEIKAFSADGPRYKALGNSMAAPVMRWIGLRLAKFGLGQRDIDTSIIAERPARVGGMPRASPAVAYATRGRAGEPELELGGDISNAPRSSPGSSYSSGVIQGEAKGDPVVYQCHGTNVGPMGTLRAGNGDVQSGVPFMVTPSYGISSDAIDRTGEGDGSPGHRAGLGIVEELSPALRARSNNSVAQGFNNTGQGWWNGPAEAAASIRAGSGPQGAGGARESTVVGPVPVVQIAAQPEEIDWRAVEWAAERRREARHAARRSTG